MSTSYLITGGAGFIGSHLAECLLSRGNTVHVIDDLSTGCIDNIVQLTPNERFSYTIDTIFNESKLDWLISRCDVVFHLAAAVGVKLVVERPVQTIDANVHGTQVVLRLAHKKQRKVLLTSSSEVYGTSDDIPFREDQDLILGSPTKTRWSYACSKAINEFLGLAYYHETRLPVVIVRLFNTVGPRQSSRYGMVIPNLVKQALTGDPITVFGSGEQTRSFIYVGDVVRGMIDLSQHRGAEGNIFNLGSECAISINALACLIKRITASSSEIVHIPYRDAYGPDFEDVEERMPSIEKVRALIGFEPTRNLREILEEVIAEQKTTLGLMPSWM